MPSPLRIEHVLTAESRAEYQKLVEQKPELPPDLEGLFQILGSRAKDQQALQDQILRTLVTHMQSPTGGPSVQTWLLWAFQGLVVGLASKYVRPDRPFDEVIGDATWCLLEVLNTISLEHKFFTWKILMETKKLVRRQYGIERLSVPPEEIILDQTQLEERLVTAQEADFLDGFNLSNEQRDLLIGHYIYGYSLKELAHQMGVNPNTLYQRISRLIRRLRQ